ncbi:MAG: hypothetical protein EOP06_19525 [Proteobacteria bacterium]|nr:MAG: hypothetical protein EOP06_19525 [Pseudomonadota bacterium]
MRHEIVEIPIVTPGFEARLGKVDREYLPDRYEYAVDCWNLYGLLSLQTATGIPNFVRRPEVIAQVAAEIDHNIVGQRVEPEIELLEIQVSPT